MSRDEDVIYIAETQIECLIVVEVGVELSLQTSFLMSSATHCIVHLAL